MNNLNSVLIEGNLIENPSRDEMTSGGVRVQFTIESCRYYNQDNEKKSEVSRFEIHTWNKTAELCFKALHNGNGVRVVGRMKQVFTTDEYGKEWPRIVVIGENVEFKKNLDA